MTPASSSASRAPALPVVLALDGPAGSSLRAYDAAGGLARDVEGEPVADRPLPAILHLPPGDYAFELWASGHHPVRTEVTVAADQELTLEPGPPEVRFTTRPRGGLAGLPRVLDVDGEGPLDIVLHHALPARGGNSAELVAHSGGDGEVLWDYAGPVNRYATVALRTRGDHAPGVVASEIRSGEGGRSLPGYVLLDPASGRPQTGGPLDVRGPYGREPLTPVALDPEGTGEAGYAIVCDRLPAGDASDGTRQSAFVSICLRGSAALNTDHSVPILPEHWPSTIRWPGNEDDYALFVTPLPPSGETDAMLWYYRGWTLILSVPEGRRHA